MDREGEIRSVIAARVLAAKEMGDLSENAEYTQALDDKAMNEGRIEELKEIIKNAVLVGPQKSNRVIAVGATVTVKSNHAERKFTIVGASEADPTIGLISNETPLGGALIGKKKGEEVEVHTPSGPMKYKILEIG